MTEKRELGKEILRGNKRQTTTEIDLTSVDKQYIGEFTFISPSLLDRMQIGVIKANFLKGTPEGQLDLPTQNIAHMAATLAKVCTDYPKWFDLDQIGDYIVLETVYDTYLEWENSFRTGRKKDNNEGDSEGSVE